MQELQRLQSIPEEEMTEGETVMQETGEAITRSKTSLPETIDGF